MFAMTAHSPLISSLPPSCHEIVDFDLVTLHGELILVGSPGKDRRACTWDPAGDRWTQYELDVVDESFPLTDLTAIGAAVVDGRIVIGRGGDHQGFAMWDLETGKVRLSGGPCPADEGAHGGEGVGDVEEGVHDGGAASAFVAAGESVEGVPPGEGAFDGPASAN